MSNLERHIRLGFLGELNEGELILNDFGVWLYWKAVKYGFIKDWCLTWGDRFWWYKRTFKEFQRRTSHRVQEPHMWSVEGARGR